jgi:phage regulator Rha-like protein
MDDKRFQQMEKRLSEQAEVTRAMNEMLNKFIAIIGNQEAARNVAPLPSLHSTCNHPSTGIATLQS